LKKLSKRDVEILLRRTALWLQKKMKIAVVQVEKRSISMNEPIKVMKFK
jgi:hypothetical protein